MSIIVTILFIVGLVCGIVEVARSQGQNVLAWGLIAVSAGLLIARLA